jgi:hypothetical protein
MLPAGQIKEKIEWLYAAEALNMLRQCLVVDYERFCLYEKSRDIEDGEVVREMTILPSSWIVTQLPRLIECKNILEQLQSMRSRVLSRQCNSI